LNMPLLGQSIPPIPPTPPHIMQQFQDHIRQEKERVETFGEIRPIIQVPEYAGHRFVVVRNRLYFNKDNKWKFFTDFLLEYGLTRFGQEWLGAQNAAAPADQHPAFVWRKQAYAFMQSQKPRPDGIFAARPNGAMAAINNFYYDLYTVDDNSLLDDVLLDRLKHRDQFQGALHELFAEATCLRAGFTIIRENERDGTRKHVEFVAVHKSTGQHILVEAKSRHRAGVLAMQGQRETSPDLNFRRLINNAIAKDPNNPLAIFVDTNLPPRRVHAFYAMQSTDPPVPSRPMAALMDKVRRDYAGVDPYNLLVFSNHPQHYSDDDRIAPGSSWAGFISQKARVPVYRNEALLDLLRAVNLYGNVPTLFPPDRNQPSPATGTHPAQP
jgi:hypothetical protein